MNFQYFIDNVIVNREEEEYTFSDLFQVAKNSGNIGVEIPVIENDSNNVRGTINVFSSRCSTAEAGVNHQLTQWWSGCEKSGVDCISFLFACWCSAIVDCGGGSGSW